MFKIRPTIIFTLFLSLLVGFFVPFSTAAADKLNVRIEPGFDGQTIKGAWYYLSVTVENEGPPFSGELRISAQNPGTDEATHYSLPVNLPADTSQQYTLTIPTFLEELTASVSDFTISSLITENRFLALRASMTAEGQTLVEESVRIENLAKTGPQLLVISDSRAGFDFVNLGLDEPWTVVYASASSLPRDWPALSAVDAVVIDDADLRQITEDQEAALTSWVALGGSLVVTAAAAERNFTSSFLQNLVPVERVRRVRLEDFTAFGIAEELLDMQTINLWTFDAPNEQVLLTADGQPVLTGTGYEAGTVYVLALNPRDFSLTQWPSKQPFMAGLLQSYRQHPLQTPMKLDRLVHLMLFSIPIEATPRTVISGTLLVLLVVVPFLFAMGMRHHKLFLLLGLPLFVVIFGFSTYWAFGQDMLQTRTTLSETAVITKRPEATKAVTDGHLILYANAEEGLTYTLPRRAGTLYQLSEAAHRNIRHTPDIHVRSQQTTAHFATEQLPMTKGLRSHYLMDMPVVVQYDADETAASLVVTNDSQFRLERLFLYANGRYYTLDSVGPHQEFAVSIELGPQHGRTNHPWRYERAVWEAINWPRELEQEVLSELARHMDANHEGAYLLALVSGDNTALADSFPGRSLFRGFLLIPFED